MATNKYIRGLTRAGFRIPKTGGGLGHVTLSGTTQVDVDDHQTQLVLAGNRNTGAFIRVSGSGASTATIIGLGRRGFRIVPNGGGAPVTVKIGSGVTTVNLADARTCRVLNRNKRDWCFAASATALTVRGIQNEQNGFFLKTAGTDTITSNNTNVSNADTVVIGAQTYTFKTNLTEKQATAVLTEGATPFANGDTLTVNNVTYTIKTTPAVANDIKVGGSGDATLDNIVKAVNGTGLGDGTDYFAGTVKPTNVTAGARSGTGASATVTFTAAVGTGTAANAYASTTTGAHSTFSGTTFGTGAGTTAGVDPVANEVHISVTNADGSLTNLAEAINAGVNPGVDYSSNTVKNVDATASAEDSVNHQITLTAIDGGNLQVSVTTTAATLTVAAAVLNDSVQKIYRGISAVIDATNPFNYQQLRRHYDRWIEG